MWMFALGFAKSHFYIVEAQKPLSAWVSMCGVVHIKRVLVPEQNEDNHCSMCIREREAKFGLFA